VSISRKFIDKGEDRTHQVINTETRDKEMKDIWYAIDYQDRRINKLVEENQDYKTRLTNTEYKLNVEVREVRKDIQGLKTHLESIVDIVNVFQTHFQQLRQNSKKQRPSTSPKLSTGVANRS
jgi:regulator of replication initiation timing